MSTNKPRVSFAISQEELDAIKEYQFSTRQKNQTQAILELIRRGLEKEESKPKFSKDELSMLESYHSLDDHGKRVADLVLEEETERCKKEKKPVLELLPPNEEPVDSFEFYSPVSAGYGVDLSDTADAKHVKLLANWYTKQADYIVRVDGESMAPRFHHGDRLLVQEADDTEIGEIGIWVINGKHYVKKKGEGKLISLNRDYPDVYPEDDYEQRCQGRVIGVLDPSWIIEE